MARRNRKIRYIDEVRSLRELQQASRDIGMQLMYVEEQFTDDVAEAFSVDTLLSVIAPEGSFAGKVVGGLGNGLATVRGIVKGLQMFRKTH